MSPTGGVDSQESERTQPPPPPQEESRSQGYTPRIGPPLSCSSQWAPSAPAAAYRVRQGTRGRSGGPVATFLQALLLPFRGLVTPTFWHLGFQLGTSFLSSLVRDTANLTVSALWAVSSAGVHSSQVLPLGTMSGKW